MKHEHVRYLWYGKMQLVCLNWEWMLVWFVGVVRHYFLTEATLVFIMRMRIWRRCKRWHCVACICLDLYSDSACHSKFKYPAASSRIICLIITCYSSLAYDKLLSHTCSRNQFCWIVNITQNMHQTPPYHMCACGALRTYLYVYGRTVEFKFVAWSSLAQSVCEWAFSLLTNWCLRLPSFEICIQQRNITCLLSIKKSLASGIERCES